MKKYSSVFLTILLVLCLIVQTGCSDSSPNSSSVPSDLSSKVSETSSEDSSSAESNASTNELSGEIEFFDYKGSAVVTEVEERAVAEFNKLYPNVKVTITSVPDAETVLKTRLASGNAPDVTNIFPNTAEFRTMVDAGYFMDLTDTDVLENVDPSFLDELKIDGKDYSAPLTMNAWGFYYNVTKFEELGLSVPATWEDFEEVCEKIKEAGYIPIATSFMEGWTVEHLTETLFLNIAGMEAAPSFFADPTVKCEDSPEFQTMLDRLDFIRNNTQEDVMGKTSNDALNMFVTGEALMMGQGIWSVPSIDEAGIEDEYAMFPCPNDSGEGLVQGGVDYAVAINAKTKYPEAAMAYAKFLASPDQSSYMLQKEGSPSLIKGVTERLEKTSAVTDTLFNDRFLPWMHFQWEAGNEGTWAAEMSSYCATGDRETLMKNIDKLFGKE